MTDGWYYTVKLLARHEIYMKIVISYFQRLRCRISDAHYKDFVYRYVFNITIRYKSWKMNNIYTEKKKMLKFIIIADYQP